MDPKRLKDWVTIHRKLGKVSDGPLKDGSTLEQTLHLRGVSIKVHWTVEEAHAPERAVWEGRGPARAKATHDLRASPRDGNGGTRFEYANEFKPPLGPIGAAANRVLMGGVPQREADRTLQRLKELVEVGLRPLRFTGGRIVNGVIHR